MKTLLKDGGLWRSHALVGGEWLATTPHGNYTVLNPATGEPLAEFPRFGEAETAHAIEAAHEAFGHWRALTAKARSELVGNWYAQIVKHADDLALLITLEEGKPLGEALGEVRYAASFVQWFAEEAKRAYGDVIPSPAAGQRIVVTREPLGVVGAITPWNFPAAMITRKAAPALAAGCTIVVKPAEQTPLTALALGELAIRAGIPPGVFNVVTGDLKDAATIGKVLTGHALVRKITFTGSTAVGKVLLAQAAAGVKKVSMELGGNAPLVVFDDADLDVAVEGAMACKFRNTGQACISANRILVQTGIHDAFASKLAQRAAALKVGDGMMDGAQQGPLISDRAVKKVREHVQDAIDHGATVITGGKPHALGGRFFEPTVLTGISSSMRLTREETFGPVAALMRFETEEEAIRLANDTEFGLAAYLFTKDAARIWRVSSRLEAGMVGINTGLISNEVAPFGGVKESGLGREGSRYGLEEFMEMKYLCWDGLA